MGFDKHSSKGGSGYSGGFLQLFDWNGKSRKKLFSTKSDLPEGSKQGKKSNGNLPMTRFQLNDDDIGGSSIKGSSDYSCASSVTDDEGNKSRGPSVVARLMGLDSLPTSDSLEPYSTQCFDTRSLDDGQSYRTTPDFYYPSKVAHSGIQPTTLEGLPRNHVDSSSKKKPNRPIDRFQTETLPPKSAKSIPITQHRLMSPIKSPGFITTKNLAHIMEAAAKIIEARPQTSTKARTPSLGSTSVPLRVRDLREKMETMQRSSSCSETSRRPIESVSRTEASRRPVESVSRTEASRRPVESISRTEASRRHVESICRTEVSRKPVESNAAKYLKGQSMNKSWNGSEDVPKFRSSPDSEVINSGTLINKGKSISLAIQAKVNVQKRECLGTSRSSLGQKEGNECKYNQSSRSQQNIQKTIQKKSCNQNASGVLRQNNQKQNSATNKDKLPSKPSVPNNQARKTTSADSFIRNKNSNKVAGNNRVGSKKAGLGTSSVEKKGPLSSRKNLSGQKRSKEGDGPSDRGGFVRATSNNKDERPPQPNVDQDGYLKWKEEDRRKGMDVVSFTFTSPMIKPKSAFQSSQLLLEKINSFCENSRSKLCTSDTKPSSVGVNVVGGDALSILLEQKLKELTSQRSCSDSVNPVSGASSSILQDLASVLNAGSTTLGDNEKRSQLGLQTNNLSKPYNSNCSPNYARLQMNHSLQDSEESGEYSSCNSEVTKDHDHRHPSPVSVLEPSFSSEGFSASDGSQPCSSTLTEQESDGTCQTEKSQLSQPEMELSDSASSSLATTTDEECVSRLRFDDNRRPDNWKKEYVTEVLSNVELMFKDFSLGRAREIINPHLYHQLENRKTWFTRYEVEKNSSLERKELFDCVSECLDLRCRRYVGGGSQRWAKGVAMVRRKEWLVVDVCKEISSWGSMGDWMVDELVDKDMSTQYGKWSDFEAEESEIGLDIEKSILNSLVDEVVVDIFVGRTQYV